MAQDMARTRTGVSHEPCTRHTRVWAVVTGRHQLGCVHHLRVQLFQAENQARLADIRRLLSLHLALFVEMYGFPLTIYLASGWIAQRFPGIDPFSHDAGHLWYTLLGFKGNPHLNPIHLASNLFILAGFLLLSASWRVLYNAQREGRLATTGPYSWVRHPQYAGFIAIMSGFLLQWPTVITLIMFPILVTVYVRLARREEAEVRAAFGQAWDDYAARTPAFIPRLQRHSAGDIGSERRAHV